MQNEKGEHIKHMGTEIGRLMKETGVHFLTVSERTKIRPEYILDIRDCGALPARLSEAENILDVIGYKLVAVRIGSQGGSTNDEAEYDLDNDKFRAIPRYKTIRFEKYLNEAGYELKIVRSSGTANSISDEDDMEDLIGYDDFDEFEDEDDDLIGDAGE